MSLVAAQTPTGRTWVARPNCSLSAAGRKLVLVVTAAVSGTIAFVFSWVGAWPVVPFTGLELACCSGGRCAVAARVLNDVETITPRAGTS
jgi:uncharacterized membrane protein